MRVLYYNWVDYLDAENRGGGVSQYQRNILQELDQGSDIDAVFLSAGISYDLRKRPPRWEQTRHGPRQDRGRRYEIVNSAVLSPAHFSFGNIAQCEDTATEACFYDFLEATGPYDVVHFNNLEGLPARVLKLKARWPQMRLILSLHNYYPFCPQVNLWFQERENCLDFNGGAKCASCLPQEHNQKQLRLAHALAYRLKAAGFEPNSRMFQLLYQPTIRVGRRLSIGLNAARRSLRKITGTRRQVSSEVASGQNPQRQSAPDSVPTPFAKRRAEMVSLINAHCDQVLAVSDFTAGVARRYGVRSDLLQTSYIGTALADCYQRTTPRRLPIQEQEVLSLGYLGYMRRDKGFFFLLEALKSLPSPLAKRIRLVVAARRGDADTMAELSAVGQHLAGLEYHDGYTHDELPAIFSQIDLGVVPVLWNDNLPQVAIEMHANHIPLLTSDLGGAQELSNCHDMVFAAGDIQAFQDRLQAILSGAVNMETYWAGARVPNSMANHLAQLTEIYTSSDLTRSAETGLG